MAAIRNNPFGQLPPLPATHFKLFFYGAVLRLITCLCRVHGSFEKVVEQFPFLAGYNNELVGLGLEDLSLEEAESHWYTWLQEWEARAREHLPLRALSEASGISNATATLLLTIGLIEEDARFGLLFDAMQAAPSQHRPTLGLLSAWWPDADGGTESRDKLRQLQELGLLQVVNPDAPRLEWALQVPGPLWDAMRGEVREEITPWAHYRPPEQLATHDELILPDALRQSLTTVSALLASGDARALVIRGPQHNGRRTVAGAVARGLGLGMLEINGLGKGDDGRWRLIRPLAALLHALPVVVLDLAPGETAELPPVTKDGDPLVVVLGQQGGLCGPGAECALTVTLEIPDTDARRLHWIADFGANTITDLDQISGQVRMTSGNIRRAARLARSYAALAERETITLADVQQASRTLNRQVLETLAAPVPVSGDWNHLAVGTETKNELHTLELRCRHRERLQTSAGVPLEGQLNVGVRVLFSGPSGTGKTLAARLLASVLQMDLYRLDLSAVVNKYIGETEKNLSQIFARAEELNVILLLDEGDALLTQRTGVQTANDRYANLETNYLLQRIESFSGILLVTTNAAEHIDSAFQRRMDVVIDFRPPDVAERWSIWQLHLPADHVLDPSLLNEVVCRCALSGSQIRNAALHAALLALNDGGIVTAAYLEEAVRREYRKAGGVCPLKSR
ncbi:MAG TPA: ATP-binding protein [Candidatus Binatia bacterium]|jgi:hypothetical protein